MTGIDLRTHYMGMQLENPLMPSASPLSRSLDTARRLEDAGAGALVMYSLFEEELRHEEEMTARFLINQETGFAEADSFLPFQDQYQHGLDQYLEQLTLLKKDLSIPIIASLNGVTRDGWVEHGQLLQEAGADALELNVYYLGADVNESSTDVEQRYLDLLQQLRQRVTIPIALKLSPYFNALPHFINNLENSGAKAVVLFNRFYQPDVDLDNLQITSHLQLSNSSDALLALRWVALLYGKIGASIAVTSGIHRAEDVLKMILVGADVTQLCSALLENGPEQLGVIKADLINWMEAHEYTSLEQLKGYLSQQHCANPEIFERANYMALLDSYQPPPGVWR